MRSTRSVSPSPSTSPDAIQVAPGIGASGSTVHTGTRPAGGPLLPALRTCSSTALVAATMSSRPSLSRSTNCAALTPSRPSIGAAVKRPRPSLAARTLAAPVRPKKKSVKPSLFTSAAATAVIRAGAAPSAARPTSPAMSANVPSRRFLNSAGAPVPRAISRSTSRRLSTSVGTMAIGRSAAFAIPDAAVTSANVPLPLLRSRTGAAPPTTRSRSPSWSASTNATVAGEPAGAGMPAALVVSSKVPSARWCSSACCFSPSTNRSVRSSLS